MIYLWLLFGIAGFIIIRIFRSDVLNLLPKKFSFIIFLGLGIVSFFISLHFLVKKNNFNI